MYVSNIPSGDAVLPNVKHLLMHKSEPVVMLCKQHHTGSTEQQIELSPGKIGTLSALEDREILDNRHLSILLQVALGLSWVSNPS